MRILYYHCLSPFARKTRVVLHEKGLEFETVVVRDWERPEDFLALNPAGEVPVLVDDDYVICGATAICEYVDESYPAPPLLSHDPVHRAEVRRLVDWFDHKFFAEVTGPTAGEKLTKRVLTRDAPDSRLIRAGRANIHTHLQYIAWLSERRRWLAGESLSLADLTAAAHLSLVDYAGDVPWEDHPLAKDWYARIKSRPSFRCLLAEMVPGVPAPAHYADLDF
jgi:glutathione S-transferase